jgi:hypothetical protein
MPDPEKQTPLLPSTSSPMIPRKPPRRGIYSLTALLVTLWIFWIFIGGTWMDITSTSNEDEHHRIPLTAHIMSKCPDAKDCLQDLIIPTMQQVGSKVDFQLEFIGK